LGILGRETSVSALLGLMTHPAWQVRATACRALGRLEVSHGTEALAAALADKEWPVRLRAREALVAIGRTQAVAALRRNPRRLTVLRFLDVARARTADRRRSSLQVSPDESRPDRVAIVRVGRGLGRAGAAAALVIGAITLVRPAPAFFAVVLILAITLSLFGELSLAEPDNGLDAPLDIARARARETSAEGHAPAVVTAVRHAFTHPLRLLAFVALPIAVDLLVGRTGAITALVAGFLSAGTVTALLLTIRVLRFERRTCQTLLTDSARDPLPGRRYYSRSR
jgi:hypothetical protein